MLKNKKGITLISLIIYVTAMTLLIAVIANISRSFYKNITRVSDTNGIEVQIEKFNTFFLKQINTSSISVNEVSETGISFSDGTQYTYNSANKSVYCITTQRNIKICDGIEMEFNYNEAEEKIEIIISDGEKEKKFYYKKR